MNSYGLLISYWLLLACPLSFEDKSSIKKAETSYPGDKSSIKKEETSSSKNEIGNRKFDRRMIKILEYRYQKMFIKTVSHHK